MGEAANESLFPSDAYSEVHIYLQESADRESKEDGFTQPLSEKFALPSASKINKVAADAAAGLV